MTELGTLFNKYGCDKASKHHYDDVYHPNLMHLRAQPINVLEIGVFKGASTKAWLDYFPKATIYGIDTFQRVPMDALDVWSHPRVKLLQASSQDPNLMFQMAEAWDHVLFDVIIDDGEHTPDANRRTFLNLINHLVRGGQYYIEDVWPLHLMNTQQMQHPWVRERPLVYTKSHMDEFLKLVYDRGHTTVEYDLRKKSGEPDSYIFKVT